MPIVQSTLLDPAGGPLVGATVRISLIASTNGRGPGYSGGSDVIASYTATTDNTGHWQATLTGNASITPSNTYYQISEAGYISNVVMPTAGGPYSVSSILVTPPPTPSSPGITAVQVAANGTVAGSRPGLNLIADSGITITAVDNPGTNEVDVTVKGASSLPLLGLLYNVEAFGAVGDGTTDDFPAVQSAWNAMIAAGLPGRLFFPRAVTYRLVMTGRVVAGTNGQYAALPLPIRASDPSHAKLSYGLLGVGEAYNTREYPGPSSTTAKNTTSTVLLLDYATPFAWSNTLGHPSFIGAPDVDHSGLSFQNVHFSAEHLTFRQPDNPSLCAMNLENIVTARLLDVCFDLNTTLDTSSEPTNPTGVTAMLPRTGNAVNVQVRNFLAWGYYAGYPITEHCDGDSLEVVACKIGAFFRRTPFAHAAQIKWFSMEEVPWGIAGYDPSQPAGVTNNGAVVACPNWVLQLLFWDVEDFDRNNTAPWMYPGAANSLKSHVYDPNNVLKGWCHYMRVDSGVNAGDFETAYVVGCNNFGLYQLASRDTAVTRLQGGNPSLVTYATDSFNRADSSSTLGTSSGGQTWSALVGTWGIKSNQGYCAADGSSYNIAVLNATNGLVTYTIQLTPQSQPIDLGMIALCQDANNLIFWDISGDPLNSPTAISTRLFQRSGGSFTGITNSATITMHSGTQYTLKMVVGATSISCYQNNTLVFASSGATGLESQTKFGMASAAGQADRNSVWDNLLITSS